MVIIELCTFCNAHNHSIAVPCVRGHIAFFDKTLPCKINAIQICLHTGRNNDYYIHTLAYYRKYTRVDFFSINNRWWDLTTKSTNILHFCGNLFIINYRLHYDRQTVASASCTSMIYIYHKCTIEKESTRCVRVKR